MAENFAENLRNARIRCNKTASQCAEALGCTVAAWSQWESGKREPSIDKIIALCRLLATTPNELLGFTPPVRVANVRAGDNAQIAIGTGIRQVRGRTLPRQRSSAEG